VKRGFEVPSAEAEGLRQKVEATLELLDRGDFVLLHLHAADEAGHAGDPERKVRTLAAFDEHVVGPLRRAVSGRSDVKWLVVLDYGCAVAAREHTREESPFLLHVPWRRQTGVEEFSEQAFAESKLQVESGAELLSLLKR
jgi:2,3-bisphosphoglycerate-independent phosphoglycerate mutase